MELNHRVYNYWTSLYYYYYAKHKIMGLVENARHLNWQINSLCEDDRAAK
jgi:hypothetical protein